MSAVAGLLGAGVAVLPAIATSSAASSPAFTASDFKWTSSDGGTTLTINPGDTVTFSYPSGSSSHNADFGATAPSSCTQTNPPTTGSVPPLPNSPTGPGWSGTCTFNTAGTYTFHCDLHATMVGTIVVQSATTTGTTGTTGTTATTTTTGPTNTTATTGTTQTTTTSSTTTAGTTGAATTTSTSPPATTPSGSSASPLAGAAASAIAILSRQHGHTVHGSVSVSEAGTGGELIVALFSTRGQRGRGRLSGAVLLARHSWRLHPGRFRFALSLGPAGRRTLAAAGRLSVQVRVSVTAPTGEGVTVTRRVLLETSRG